MNSFTSNVELGRILQRSIDVKARILPVLLGNVSVSNTPLEKFKHLVLREPADPVQIANAIHSLISKLPFDSKKDHKSLCRITFKSGQYEDFQYLTSSMLEVSRIYTILKLLDESSKSFNPKLVMSLKYDNAYIHELLDESDRLETVAINKTSPTWVEIGTLTFAGLGFAVLVWQAIIAHLQYRENVRRNNEDRKWRVYEVISRALHEGRLNSPDIEDKILQRAADIITHSTNRLSLPKPHIDSIRPGDLTSEELSHVRSYLSELQDKNK